MRLNSNIKYPVKIDDQKIEDVETLTYLKGIVISAGSFNEDIINRLGKAKVQFRRIKKISIQTKIRLFNGLVVSVLIYGSQTWKITEQDKTRLIHFQRDV